MKKLITLIISLCFVANVLYADDWQLVGTPGDREKSSPSALNNNIHKQYVITTNCREAKIYNTKTGTSVILTGHTNYVKSALFNHDGTQVLTVSNDKTVKIWNAKTGECIRTLTGHNKMINTAVFNHNGTQIVTASCDNTVKIWNAKTGECIHTLTGHTDFVLEAVFNHSSTRVVTASDDHTAKIWNTSSGDCICTLSGHTDLVLTAEFNHGNTRVITSSHDGIVKIWDTRNGKCIFTLPGPFYNCATFNRDGTKIIATLGSNREIWQDNEAIRIRNERLPFTCAIHPRLGANSPAGVLPRELVELICSHVNGSRAPQVPVIPTPAAAAPRAWYSPCCIQ